MRRLWFLSLLFLLAVTAIAAELVISSFNQNGELTWTNSFSSNATYRVEWAGSADGPWNKFDALTNLSLLPATNSTVTVKVPTFYRVVWLDPPPPEPQGTWDYGAYDFQGVLGVTGRLSFAFETNQFANITGTRNLQLTGNSSTNGYFLMQVGTGAVRGELAGYDFFLNLDPRTSDDYLILRGRMIGTFLSGIWARQSMGPGEEPMETFVAVKEASPASGFFTRPRPSH